MELESPKVESFFQFSQSLVSARRDDDYSLFKPEGETSKLKNVGAFDAFQIPAAPTDFEDVLSQVTQTDVTSTQVFNKNCEKFRGVKELARHLENPRSLSKNPRIFNTFGSQIRAITNEESLPGYQNSQHRTSLGTYDDEETQLMSSPELFTTRNDGLESASPDDNGQQDGCDYFNSQQYGDTRHSRMHNVDTPGQFVIQDSQRYLARGDSSGDHGSSVKLRSTAEIPEPFRSVFKGFPYFNIVQSTIFKEVMYTDKPMVVCAPTGSGKTVIFELAIVRLLMNAGIDVPKIKIVYMAPMKALCSERMLDWTGKFEPLGLKCKEVTGDSQLDDYFELQEVQIIMTTPEKWDSITRKWKDNRSLVDSVKLFLIDEIHLLNDGERGATVEAVISRMKTVQATSTRCSESASFRDSRMRLLAISATIPNIVDVALWLGSLKNPATHYSMDDSYRPVKLRKVVLGFSMSNSMTEFRFDLSLNYKLSGIIQAYSNRKPTLVFCSTRKSAQQAASTLINDARFIMNSQHCHRLQRIANSLHDAKLRELVVCGVGFHHAGLDSADRKLVEALFTKADLPVLFSTSTLAVGVNLPAHLVILKSTTCYIKGMFVEYSEAQILQMIGRAGRPQFDTSATAVIMTTAANKERYTALIEGSQHIESSLHHHLIEHLNAEIVLNTITDVSIALEWLKSTFLYIRILKNPTHYGIPQGLGEDALEQKLQDICLRNLNTLEKAGLIRMDDGFDLKPKEPGRLMARYFIAYDSMKRFLDVKKSQSLDDLVALISKCKEFSDVKLRVNEKRVLNSLNRNKEKTTVRFPITGRIKSTDQKVNCLIQATLGCLQVNEFSLNQDVSKIFRSGQRVSRCLTELMMLKDDDHKTVLNAVIMEKCLKSRLWENSQFVSRQLEKVGVTLSNLLVNAGLITFKKMEETHPREIELIVNRHPPFGSQIRDAASSLPKYEVSIEQIGGQSRIRADIVVTVAMTNYMKRKDFIKTDRVAHFCVLIVGDAANRIVHKQRLGDAVFMREGAWSKRVEVKRTPKSLELNISLISQGYVGIDVHSTFTPYYNGPPPWTEEPQILKRSCQGQALPNSSNRKAPRTASACNHRCLNKAVGHECCKYGVAPKTTKAKRNEKRDEGAKRSLTSKVDEKGIRGSTERSNKKHMESFLNQLHQRTQAIPGTPAAKRLRAVEPRAYSPNTINANLEKRFGYTPRMKPNQQHRDIVHVDREPEILNNWDDIDWHELHHRPRREEERVRVNSSAEGDYFEDCDDDSLLAHPWCYDEDMSVSVQNADINASKPSASHLSVTDNSGRMGQSLQPSGGGDGHNTWELSNEPTAGKKKHCTTITEVQITKVASVLKPRNDISCVKNFGYLPPSPSIHGGEDLSRAGQLNSKDHESLLGQQRSGHHTWMGTHWPSSSEIYVQSQANFHQQQSGTCSTPSFFCSSSFESSHQENEEQDVFCGIFHGLF